MYSLTDRNTIILYFGVCFLNRRCPICLCVSPIRPCDFSEYFH